MVTGIVSVLVLSQHHINKKDPERGLIFDIRMVYLRRICFADEVDAAAVVAEVVSVAVAVADHLHLSD